MHRFFLPTEQLHGPDPWLEGKEAKHIVRVLRMNIGDEVLLFDNTSQEYQARISSIDRGRIHFEILGRQIVMRESSLQVTLGLPLIRPQPLEWILQKGTELGVFAFRPYFSSHSRRNFEKSDLESRRKRWERIIVEAAKQSERTLLPELFPPISFSKLLEASHQDLRVLPYEEETARSLKELEHLSRPVHSIFAVIGPEGGFLKEEVIQAQGKGFIPITLGPRILRSETAALSLLSLLQYLWGDMGSTKQ